MTKHFKSLSLSRIGAHSRWVESTVPEMITSNIRKSNKVDAHLRARLARVDRQLLCPVIYRDRKQYPAIAQLRARNLLVRARTRLINPVRGISNTMGLRIPACGSSSFRGKAASSLPEELKPSLMPLLETIAHLNKGIYGFDKAIEGLNREQYPEKSQLR